MKHYCLIVKAGAPALDLPGRVVTRGVGTADDAAASWVVIRTSSEGVSAVRERLRQRGISDHVVRIDALSNPHQGADYARQLTLV